LDHFQRRGFERDASGEAQLRRSIVPAQELILRFCS
jgi:hypothetical protein